MKKTFFMLGLLVLGLMITGCTGMGSCNYDGVCSIDEQYVGGCSDCLPDFEVTDDNIYLSYDEAAGIFYADVCVLNKNYLAN